MESIDYPNISADIVVLAVAWNEVEGPTIISKSPEEGLPDPINIALQIYLSSVAVFGQHGQTKRVDFSLPLLSISSNHIVRVAFDSWPDHEVRGDERPFFIGFIMDRDRDKLLADFIQMRIWHWMDQLKEVKMNFKTFPIYEEIIKFLSDKTIKNETNILSENHAKDNIQSYSVNEALDDLEKASELWTKDRDRSILNDVLKAAYRLEGTNAGNAYFLAGNIFFNSADYENALESYNRALNAFKSDVNPQSEGIGESMFNVAISAYRLERFDIAKTNLVLSSSFIKDSIRKARMFLYLAQTQFRLGEYDNASNSFELAIDNALEGDDSELAGQILSVFASRLQERAGIIESPSLRFTLLELSANQRQKASEYFKYRELTAEAGTSLVLASKTYQMIKHYDIAIKTLEEAAELFLGDSDFYSAGRALYDVIELYKNLPSIKREDLLEVSDRAHSVIMKITDETVKISLLAKLIREKAKIFESLNDFVQAKEIYESLYQEAKSFAPTSEILSVYLSYANLLFQIEDYKKAGDIFYQIYSNFDPRTERAQKILKNTNISYKRALSGYLYAGTILLHKNSLDQAIEFFNDVIQLLKMVSITSPDTEKESNKKFIDTNMKSLEAKCYLLPNLNRSALLKLIKGLNFD